MHIQQSDELCEKRDALQLQMIIKGVLIYRIFRFNRSGANLRIAAVSADFSMNLNFFNKTRKKLLTFNRLSSIINLVAERHAAMAQVVEHILGKDEVTSSNLVSSSIRSRRLYAFEIFCFSRKTPLSPVLRRKGVQSAFYLKTD